MAQEMRIIKDGAVVYVCGYEFIVSDVTIEEHPKLGTCVYFTGTCTADERNDSIRHTSYNGGRYGGSRKGCYSAS